MRSKPFSALFKIFVSLTLVVSLAPSVAWAADDPTGGGSTLTTAPQGSDDTIATDAAQDDATQGDAAQNVAAPQKGPRKAPAATDDVAEVNGTQYATLKEAILAAPAKGTVTVLRDFIEYVTNDRDGKEITIDLGGYTWTATNGMAFGMSGKAALYTTKAVTIKNGTITGGDTAEVYSGRYFGAVTANANTATLTFDNVTFTGNKGCIVWSYYGGITIQNSQIVDNNGISSAGDEAYGLVGNSRNTVYIDKSVIKNNTGGYAPVGSVGTATANQPSTYTFIATTVEGNVGSKAGAVYYKGRQGGVTLNNSTFTGNKGGRAGAIFFEPTTNTLAVNMYSNSLITKNEGAEANSTGGIYLALGKATFSSSAVYRNTGSDFLIGNIDAALPAASTMVAGGAALSDYYYEHGQEGDSDYQKFDVGTSVPSKNYSPVLSLVVTNGRTPEGVDPNGPWQYGDYRFATLEKAAAAYQADEGTEGSITLLQNVEESATVAALGTASKPAVVDLGGFTLTAADSAKPAMEFTGAAYATIQNGSIDGGTIGLNVRGANSQATVKNLAVKNSTKRAISMLNGQALTVQQSTFDSIGSEAGNGDYAIYCWGELTVDDATITNSKDCLYASSNTTIALDSLKINGNTGRALFLYLRGDGTLATVRNSTIENNTMSGGRLIEASLGGKSLTFEGCKIANNTGANSTVSISGSNSTVNLKDTEVSGNSAVGLSNGGTAAGVYAGNNKLTLADSVIKNNVSTSEYSENADFSYYLAGGVYSAGSNAALTLTGSSAIYGNTATSSATTEVANDIFCDGATLNVPAARDMVDGTHEFTDWVWDDLHGNAIESALSGKQNTARLLTAKPASDVAYVAKIGDVGYKTLAEAFAAATDGDTIKIVIKETNPAATTLTTPAINVTKDVTLDLNGIHIVGSDATLFSVGGSGKLAVKDSVADKDADIAAYSFTSEAFARIGGIEGTIKTTGGGGLAFQSSFDTRNATIDHQGETLQLAKPINPLEVSLGADKFIELGEGWQDFASAAVGYSSPRIAVTLDSAVLASLNDDNYDEPDVVIATGASAYIKDYIKIDDALAGHVRKMYLDPEGSDEVGKLVLRQYPLLGVYVDGASGKDLSDGGEGTIGVPVRTFEEAKSMLAQQPDAEGIIVLDTIVVTASDTAWNLAGDDYAGRNKLIRFEDFKGNLVRVESGASLALTDIVVDGQGDNGVVAGKGSQPGDGSLIYVKPGGKLVVDDGTVLQNNYVQNTNEYTSCGGAIYSAGTTTIKDGTIRFNRAIQGGGVYQSGGKLDMTGGAVESNKAIYPAGKYGASLMPAGGGIMLANGANMNFTGGAVKSNTSENVGGGISLGTTGDASSTCLASSGTTTLTMNGANAVVENNTATSEGGGIYVQVNTVAHVVAGTISNNEAKGITQRNSASTGGIIVGGNVSHGGGGIYVNGCAESYYNANIKQAGYKDYAPGTLYLSPAEIARNESGAIENSPQYGGSALAFCASGDAQVFEVASSVIYDNISKGNIDVFMTTVDHQTGQVLENAAGNSMVNNIKYYVAEYAVGGEPYNWQQVDVDGTQEGSGYTMTPVDDIRQLHWNDHRLALHTDLSANDVADSLAEVSVHIVGNKAGRYGGGVGSNGLVVNGVEAPLVDIAATKSWSDNNQNPIERPTSLTFNLERKKVTEDDAAFTVVKTKVVEATDGTFAVEFKEQPQYAEYDGEGASTNVEWMYRIVEDESYKPEVADSPLWKGEDAADGKAIADIYKVTTAAQADTTRDADANYAFDSGKISVKNFTVTNTLKTGELKVAKTVTGDGADAGKEFTFTVTLDTKALNNIKLNGTFGDMEFKDNVAEFTLKGGESKKATGLPAGVTYTVAEADYSADGYTTTKTGDAGTIEADKTASAAFTNTYKPTPDTAQLTVEKTLAGDWEMLEKDALPTFTFFMKPVGDAPAPASDTVSIQGAGTATFGAINFAKAGNYSYTITEDVPSELPAGWSYNPTGEEYTVAYTVTDEGGKLKVSAPAVTRADKTQASGGAVVFTNDFKATPTKETIPVEKAIAGDAEKAANTEFTFELTADEGNPTDAMPAKPTVSIKGAGKAEFGAITFSAAGVYRYTVTEVAPNPLPTGWTYDTAVYTIEYTVELVGAKLVATPTLKCDGEPVSDGGILFKNAYEEPKTPPEEPEEPKPVTPTEPEEPEYEPSVPVDVVMIKHLKDALIHQEEFSFGLYDEEGRLLDTVYTTLGTHTGADEYSSVVEIAFKDLVFSNPGVYNYTIREHVAGTTQVVEGDEWNQAGFEPGFYKGGVKYDDREYPVVITVGDSDEDGRLEADVEYLSEGGSVRVHELVNEYSEEYIEIDEFDSHPNDGLHEPEPEETDKPTPTPPADTTKKDSPKTPTTKPSPKAGSVRTSDTNPVAPLSLLALVAAATAGFAFTRRRRRSVVLANDGTA